MAVYTVDLDRHDENGGKIRVVRKRNRTWQCFGFPRSLLDAVDSGEIEDRSGVYVLWGYKGDRLKSHVYVGQSDEVFKRLETHMRSSDKDYWEQTVVFTSTDQGLHTTHVKYIEAELVRLARQSNRILLMNATAPRTASLRGADLTEVEEFFSDLLDCLAVLGVDFFEPPEDDTAETTTQTKSLEASIGGTTAPISPKTSHISKDESFLADSEVLSIRSKGIVAHGYERQGKFVVKAGSQAAKTLTDSARTRLNLKHIPEWRDKLIHGYKDDKEIFVDSALEDKGSYCEFVRDFSFNSPSAASCQILGASSNGNQVWKDENGISLAEIRRLKAPNRGRKVTIKTAETRTDNEHNLFLKHKGIEARGYISANGFVVTKGSQAINDESLTNSMPTSSVEQRREFIGDGTMKLDGSVYMFTKSGTFNSPSQAAGALLGSSYNGNKYWRDAAGRTLGQIRKS